MVQRGTVNYRKSRNGDERCGNCLNYRGEGKCSRVIGLVERKHSCDLFMGIGETKVSQREAGIEDEAPPELDPKVLSILNGDNYSCSPTMERFHSSTAFVRAIRGPVRGGKSTAMCQELLRRAREQSPGADGIRRTRFVVVRNTYGELKDTTIKTWLDWVPEEIFGKFNRSQGEMNHHIRVADIDCEVMFRALDKPGDVKKVLSLEVTGGWVNEAREIPRAIIDALGDRVGQFPAKKDGGCSWGGLLLDTNSPSKNHWWYTLSEEETPEGWEFFSQPPAVIQIDGKWKQNPDAENVSHLNEPNYYEVRAAGKREDYIKVYYGNQYGFVQEGKPVFPEYADHVHGCKTALDLVPNLPVYIGVGVDLESAAIFAQKKANGQWWCLDELTPEYGGAVNFAELLADKMKDDFPIGTVFRVYGPTPKQADDEVSEALQIMRTRKISIRQTRVAEATLLREAVASPLARLTFGQPTVQLSAKCKLAREALAGGYCYARMQVTGEERYHNEPMKNRYKQIAEAVEYMMVGGGEDAAVFKRPPAKKLNYQSIGVV